MDLSLLGTCESRAKRLLICQKPKESNSIEVAIQLIIERSLVLDGPDSGIEHKQRKSVAVQEILTKLRNMGSQDVGTYCEAVTRITIG